MRRRNWVETEGTIASVEEHQGRNSKWYTVVFTYKVDGHFYGGTYSTWTDDPVVDDKISVKYDPDDPDRNDLVAKDTVRRWVLGVVIAVGILVFLIVQGWR